MLIATRSKQLIDDLVPVSSLHSLCGTYTFRKVNYLFIFHFYGNILYMLHYKFGTHSLISSCLCDTDDDLDALYITFDETKIKIIN